MEDCRHFSLNKDQKSSPYISCDL